MKQMKINPATIVQEYLKELHDLYRSTDDMTKKDILKRRLINLQNVLQFLSRTHNDHNAAGNYA